MVNDDPVSSSLYLPLDLIIILDLHDLVTDPELVISEHPLSFLFGRWIEVFLKNPVQALHAERTLAHRG